MLRTPSRRQQMFRDALSRESNKAKKTMDRGEGFRAHFPYGIFFLWIVFLGVIIYVFFFSSYLFVTRIEARSSGQVTQNEILNIVQPILESRHFMVLPAKNYFLVPEEKIRRALLAEYPVIQEVVIERSFPQSLAITLKEREKLLLWCSGGPCALVDGEQAWFQEKSFESRYDAIRLKVTDTSALPFSVTTPLPVKEYLHYFSLLQEKFPQELGQTLLLEASTPSRFSRELRVTTSEGWVLLASIDIPLEETMLSLRAFFENRQNALDEEKTPLVLVDARVPGRIFFTEEGGKQEEAVPLETEIKKEEEQKEKKKDEKKKER